MLMFAVLARERGRLCLLSSLAFLAFAIPAHAQQSPANSSPAGRAPKSVVITVKPLTANATEQKTTCASKQKCTLPVSMQIAGKTVNLTVNASYVLGNLLLNFQTPDGYYYTGSKPQADPQHPIYRPIWGAAVTFADPTVYAVTLFEPMVPRPITSIFDPQVKAVADVQITVGAGQ